MAKLHVGRYATLRATPAGSFCVNRKLRQIGAKLKRQVLLNFYFEKTSEWPSMGCTFVLWNYWTIKFYRSLCQTASVFRANIRAWYSDAVWQRLLYVESSKLKTRSHTAHFYFIKILGKILCICKSASNIHAYNQILVCKLGKLISFPWRVKIML